MGVFDKDAYSKQRRNDLTGSGHCLNGRKHAKPSPGDIRCDWCKAVHCVGVENAITNAGKDPNAPQPPLGYVYRGPRRKQ